MDFQVLGPLRVEDEGEFAPLGGPKQRAVLACLIASRGRPVSTDSLLQGVYGPDAEPSSRRSLHTYISTLRNDVGIDIQRASGGYVLAIEPDAIDAVRFERNLERSRVVVDGSVATQLLHSALGLWRGVPYQDVDLYGLRAEITRLEAMRLEALEARIELDLAAGRHRQLVGELETLTREFPLQEGFRAHQMVAMYRCGRQADALRVYHDTRTTLRDQLGLDPSPQLRELEQRILEQDADLDYRPQARLRPLPVRYTSFVGRSAEVEHAKALVDQHRLVTITGPGGIGKSSLAIEVARVLGESMRVLYVPVEAQREADPLVVMGDAMGLSASSDEDLARTIVEVLEREPTVVVFDGCEYALGQMSSLADRILGASESSRLLLTSREALYIAGEHVVRLGSLTTGPGSPASQLFYDRAQLRSSSLDESEIGLVIEIGEQLDGLPLALELVAARHRQSSLSEIRSRLDSLTELLAAKRGPVDRHLSITAALDWSYDLLTPELQEGFDRLSVFQTGISPEGASIVLDVEDPGLILDSLEDASLVGPADDDGRRMMLEPIRQYGWMHLERADAIDEVRRRYCEWLAQLCRRIHHLAWVERSPESLRLLTREVAEIEATVAWAVNGGHVGCVFVIVAAIGRLWPVVTDPTRLRELAMVALDHPLARVDDTYIQATALTAWLHRMDRQDVLEELVARIDDLGFESVDPTTEFAVGRARLLGPAPHGWWLVDDQTVVDYDGLIESAVAAGYPREGALYNRVVLLESVGRVEEAERDIDVILEWAGDAKALDRGRALQVKARHEILRGEFDAAVASAHEAYRLLVEAGDLDFAAEAQYKLAHVNALFGRGLQARKALERIDELHALIGLPPVAEEDPSLAAWVAATNDDWPTFVACMQRLIDQTPDPDDEGAWKAFLHGEVLNGPPGMWVLEPTVRWLLTEGRTEEARQIVASAPMAFASTIFDMWEAIGHVARFEELAAELAPVGEGLPDLASLWHFVSACMVGTAKDTT